MNDDAPEHQALIDLIHDLPAVDADPTSVERIAARTRRDVGHGPPRARLVLPILVAALAVITIAWAVYKFCEALR